MYLACEEAEITAEVTALETKNDGVEVWPSVSTCGMN